MLITRSRAVTAAIAATAALAAPGTADASASQPNAQATPNVRVGGPKKEGRIWVNERSYLAQQDSCITVMGVGATSFNVRNDSRSKLVDVFNGAVCDDGAPLATVGPKSSTNGLLPSTTATIFVHGSPNVTNVPVASFRVLERTRTRTTRTHPLRHAPTAGQAGPRGGHG
ncbi:hypothetical protein ACWGQ5_56350 [Streptomyces sp. NPDC055722]